MRGGYITAFVGLAFISEQLLLYDNLKRKNWFVICGMSVLVLFAHSFFIISVLPLLAKRALKIDKKDILPIIGFTASLAVLMRALAYLNTDFWLPAGFGTFNLEWLYKYAINGFISIFTGFFSFEMVFPVPDNVRYGAMAFCFLIVFAVLLSLWKFDRNAKIELILLLVGTFASIFLVTFGVGGGRYLIPFFTGVFLILVFLSVRAVKVKPMLHSLMAALGIVVLLPTLTGFDQYRNGWFFSWKNDMRALTELTDAMKSTTILHGFVSDWQINWQLNYLTDGTMKFREFYNLERVQSYVDAVNGCYLSDTCSVVLIGLNRLTEDVSDTEEWGGGLMQVNEHYYIMENPTEKLLIHEKIELPKID